MNPLQIAGELSIGKTDELLRLFSDTAAQSGDVVLDLSAVEECDAAALQLICSLRKTVAARSQHLRIAALSPAVAEIAAVLGLAAEEYSTHIGGGKAIGV